CARNPAAQNPKRLSSTATPGSVRRPTLLFNVPLHPCHSERSKPTLSSAFAPANTSACVVEESLFVRLFRGQPEFSTWAQLFPGSANLRLAARRKPTG